MHFCFHEAGRRRPRITGGRRALLSHPGWDPMTSRNLVGQRREGPAVTTHWPAAQGVSIHARGAHALATPGFSTLLPAILPSSTAAQETEL